MKLKLRFDKTAILDFLLQNVEKIVLGLVAVVFLLMAYSAIGVPRYKKTPEQLIQAVKIAEDDVAKTPPETGLKVSDYEAQAKKSRTKIVEKPYETPLAWNPPIFPKRPLRDSPALYAATELRGAAEVGAFTMAVEAEDAGEAAAGGNAGAGGAMPMARTGGTETRGQRWIVLTALVPIEKQISAFEELKNAGPHGSYDPNRDYPQYPGYWVERIELTSPGDAANPDWTKAEKVLSKTVLDKTTKQWRQQTSIADVVSPEYLDPVLTFPLGPRTDGPWGKSVAHPDEIPLLEIEGAGGIGAGGRAGVGMPGMGMPGMGMPGMGMPMPGVGAGGGVRRTRVPRAGGMGMPGVGGQQAGGAAIADPNNPFGVGDATADENAALTNLAEEAQAPAHLLFRYFDFNVSPGKRYIYRVRLALTNPNYKLKPAWLKDPKLANLPILEAKWSEPSPVIAVPNDSRILAVSVKPARASVDPSGKIIVTKWSKKKGIEAWEEFPVVRGLLANFADKTFNPATGTGRPAGGMGMPMGPGGMGRPMMHGGMNGLMGLEGIGGKKAKGADAKAAEAAAKKAEAAAKKAAKKAKADKDAPGPDMFGGPLAGVNAFNPNAFKVNYFSHAVVVDFRGGEVLPGRRGNSLKVTSGGDILLIDADGNLLVCNELDDEAIRKSLRSAETEKKEMENAAGAGPGAGMMPGGMPPGGGLEGLMRGGGAQPRKK